MNTAPLINSIFKFPKYLVGGAVRDSLLKRPVSDADIALDCPPEKIRNYAFLLAAKIKGSAFPLDEERCVWRIQLKDSPLNIDLSPLKDGNLAKDLKKRDFTVNSMAYPFEKITKLKPAGKKFSLGKIKEENLTDPLGGAGDLKKKILKISSAGAIKEDPLRMLRAVRFSAALGFKIEKKTAVLIKKSAPLIVSCAGERIKEELLVVAGSPKSAFYFRVMKENGLLFALFPELKLQEKCAVIYYGKGGVLKHTFNVVERMDLLFSNPWKFLPKSKKIKNFLRDFRLLKLAALLHDVAKPHTAREINGRLRFFGHEERGAFIAAKMLEKYRFSNDEIRYISKIIGQHLRVGNIAHNETISDRAVYKIFSDMGIHSVPLLILSWADHASYIPAKKLEIAAGEMKKKPFKIPPRGLPRTGFKKTLRFIQVVNWLIRYYSRKSEKIESKNILDGNEVMKVLGLKPGPEVGGILKRVKLLNFEGKFRNKKDAIAYIKTLKLNK